MPRTIDQRFLISASVALVIVLVIAIAMAMGGGPAGAPVTAEVPVPGSSIAVTQTTGEGSTPSVNTPPNETTLVTAGLPTTPPATAVPPTGPDPPAGGIAPDSIAAVTGLGNGLRVRTAPGVGGSSRRLEPLLPSDTRMFVVSGPVRADGLDWYEVLVAPRGPNLFGWVAAGKDGETWIEEVEPECFDTETWILAVSAIEHLACIGGGEVGTTLQFVEGLGPLAEGVTAADIMCPQLVDSGGCDVTEVWLQIPGYQATLESAFGDATVDVAIVPDWDGGLEGERLVEVTGGRDAPESQQCRVVATATGEDVIPRAEAITRCRLAFVVRTISATP